MDVREVMDNIMRQWDAMTLDRYDPGGAELVFKFNKTFEFRDVENGKVIMRGVWGVDSLEKENRKRLKDRLDTEDVENHLVQGDGG